jgi:probable phosphoglycerate mutase
MAGRFRAAADGGARGNPGPAAWAVVVLDEEGAVAEGHAGYLGPATNNVAEYHGLLEALRLAAERGATTVEVRADSELVVRQMQGRYRVRHPALLPLWQEAVRLSRSFPSFRIVHVPRGENKDADRLVNAALDRAAALPGEPVRIREGRASVDASPA